MHYPPDMDKECIRLCDALNELPGITTIESCCGHGRDMFRIFFDADSLKDLGVMVQFFSSCHNGKDGWLVEVYGLCDNEDAHLVIRGPMGSQAYEDSKSIASKIMEYVHETL